MYRIIWMIAVLVGTASGQTQVDLRTQSKSVDFSSASSTKPLTTGAVLPASCVVGQMFFLSSAPAGQNVYGCVAVNTWNLQSGGGGGGSGVSVEAAGTLVGTSGTLNFSAGLGTLFAISDTGPLISIQSSVNTAVTPTLASDQAGGTRLCSSASGSAAVYTCSMAPTLTMYTTGMVLEWKPDLSGSGGPTTLNIDFLGTTSLKLADGLTDPAPGDIVAGRMQQIWYDGATFRLFNGVVPAGVLGEPLPVCNLLTHGRLWFVAGATGVKDSLSACAKDATNTYAWRTLY
jgi:hypothetical protein